MQLPVDEQVRLAAVARGDEPGDLLLAGGRVLSVHTREWLDADVLIAGERVASIIARDGRGEPRANERIDVTGRWLVPGFIDAHVHVESSKLTIPGFAEIVVPRGTTAIVTEPHEIGNVLGVEGTEWFMDSAEDAPLTCWFMVPSCVPASQFESPGASIDAAGMERLLRHPRALGVGELMNFPAIIAGDRDELSKIRVTGATHADGHAPGVRGRELDAYAAAGIGSDHESTSVGEALDKRRRGMWVLMREASNARNLRDLIPLVLEHGTAFTALCTDDREPDHLMDEGHIDHLVRTCIADGIDPIDAYVLGTLHPALAHGIERYGHGSLTPGSRADVVVLSDVEQVAVDEVYVGGGLVAADGRMRAAVSQHTPRRVRETIRIGALDEGSFTVRSSTTEHSTHARVRVVGARDGQLLTDERMHELPVQDGCIHADAAQDVAKLAVVERHHASGRIGMGFVHGFGLEHGAFASTVAHDAHNLIIVGMDDTSMRSCAERLAQIGGGIAVADGTQVVAELALPVAGLMTDADPSDVVRRMHELHRTLATMGVRVDAPFMVLSFLALSVIPSLKLTDHGYVDVNAFHRVSIEV